MSKCALEGKINHINVATKFREAVVPCTLFPDKAVCIHCCLRISQVVQALSVPLFVEKGFPSELIESEVKLHKQNLVQQMPGHLKKYYETLPKESKKSWDAIARECGMCPVHTNLLDGDTASIIADEAEPMR
jgi:hypothetical protein